MKRMETRRDFLSALSKGLFGHTNRKFIYRGNPKSRYLLIGPPFSIKDSDIDAPFCGNPEVSIFSSIFNQLTGRNLDSVFLIISCTDDVGKPVKSNVQGFMKLLNTFIADEMFDLYCCVGSDSFKTAFGRGKKPSMRSLSGNMMTMGEAGYKPVYVIPDIEPLSIVPQVGADYRLKERAESDVLKAVKTLAPFFKP